MIGYLNDCLIDFKKFYPNVTKGIVLISALSALGVFASQLRNVLQESPLSRRAVILGTCLAVVAIIFSWKSSSRDRGQNPPLPALAGGAGPAASSRPLALAAAKSGSTDDMKQVNADRIARLLRGLSNSGGSFR